MATTPEDPSPSRGPNSVRWRGAFAAGLLLVELCFLAGRFSTATLRPTDDLWSALIARAGIVPQVLVLSGVACFLFARDRLESAFDDMRVLIAQRSVSAGWLLAQLLAFAALFVACEHVFEGGGTPGSAGEVAWIWPVSWVLSALATAFCALALVFSPRVLASVSSVLAGVLIGSFVLGIAAWGLGQWVADVLRLPLRGPTLWLARGFLGLFTDHVEVDPEQFIFGTENFRVRVAPQCSGFEGLGLMAVFSLVFLWGQRDILRFPRAWLLPLLGLVLVWIGNALRLAALVALGSWFSPSLAAGGFHSLAGLFLFCALALALVYLARRSTFFVRAVPAPRATVGATRTTAYLGPFLASIAVATLVHGFGPTTAALLPLRFVAAVIVVLSFRRAYAALDLRCSWSALASGAFVALAWWWLATPDARLPNLWTDSLENWSSAPRFGWLALRWIGFVFVAPLVEELAFRVYLLRRIGAEDYERVGPGSFSKFGWLLSSLLFGATHGAAWLPALAAGLAYGWMYMRRGRAGDAFWSHVATNACLALASLVA